MELNAKLSQYSYNFYWVPDKILLSMVSMTEKDAIRKFVTSKGKSIKIKRKSTKEYN
jgi:hypothetical protein